MDSDHYIITGLTDRDWCRATLPLYLALKFLFYAARQHFHAGKNATEASPLYYVLYCVQLLETVWRICRLMQSSSACVEAVLKGVFMSVPSPSEVPRKPQAHWKTDGENSELLTLRRLLL